MSKMAFMDEIGGGGAKLLKFDGKAGNYVVRDSDTPLNGEEFVADIHSASGGFLKFNGKDQPERRMGSLFPEDKAPSRASLGDLDKSKWPKARFGDDVEDPWTAVIEIPMTHKESGEAYIFTAQSKTALAAAKDFLSRCRRVPEGFLPTVKLGIGSYKSKFGAVKKPTLSLTGKSPVNGSGAADKKPFNDDLGF